MNAWYLWLSRDPVLTISGVEYGIELIVYIDGSNSADTGNTTAVLYVLYLKCFEFFFFFRPYKSLIMLSIL